MTNRRSQDKQPLIRQALSLAAGHDAQVNDEDYLRFSRLFLRALPVETLNEKSPAQHAVILRQCWKAMKHSPAERATLRLITPASHEHSDLSSPSCIVIVARDMPWLIESVRTELNRKNITMHYLQNAVIDVVRDAEGRVTCYQDPMSPVVQDARAEAIIYVEIDRHSDATMLHDIESGLTETLRFLYQARQQRTTMIRMLSVQVTKRIANDQTLTETEIHESRAFIDWLREENFLFLAHEELAINHDDKTATVTRQTGPLDFTPGDSEYASLNLGQHNPIFSVKRDRRRCDFYRNHYFHQIIVDHNDGKNLSRFYGIFTTTAILTPPEQIPLVREKIVRVKKLSGLQTTGHRSRELARILHTYPWEELLIATTSELLQTAMSIYNLQERRGASVFARIDPGQAYISVLYYVPKDTYCTALRLRVQKVLLDYFSATTLTFSTTYSNSILSRTHFYLSRDPGQPPVESIEGLQTLIAAVSLSWDDQLHAALQERLGEEAGNALFYRFGRAFSLGYQEHHSAQDAVNDILCLAALSPDSPPALRVDRGADVQSERMGLKIFSTTNPLMLSEVVPVLDNAGVQVESENTWMIDTQLTGKCWIHQFSLIYSGNADNLTSQVLQQWQDNLADVMNKNSENDRLNRLVLDAGLRGFDVMILRALSRYMHQLRLGFSQPFIIETLNNYPAVAAIFSSLFNSRFAPDIAQREQHCEQQKQTLERCLEGVKSLNEERVLRSFTEVLFAIVRTSGWQQTETPQARPFIAFKFSPQSISGVRQPCPLFEMFVYNAEMEGVHLRFGKVARGGLRWSDRSEDYRTEVLGLVKAQRVKNAVIVPVGAKGGFIVRQPVRNATRAETVAQGISCYRLFIRGLLSLTDNLIDGQTVPPANTLCYDDEDPYLVVAADKGTATFSDIANQLASEANFWLDDAFASGGSQGYDHKKIGITAKGAWESVRQHFYERGLDAQKDAFSVIGIGDMAGDVFGNGMLLSAAIKLIAAFNHNHIFIDPAPDCKTSYQERVRLFNLPGSAWSDYRPELLSAGGGIFSRDLKRITLSPEIQQRFDISASVLSPDELIKHILCAECDMLWSGGIGTYVKASQESDSDVGDKNNDTLRINGRDLRTHIVAEGGNLGLTQLARIEFAAQGGTINTDFIDNAGGVDCSDHEVNIKILLNLRVARHQMTIDERNTLLKSMTDSVASCVLSNNRHQALALSLAQQMAVEQAESNIKLIRYLETQAGLDRDLEYLPDEATLMLRRKEGKGLSRPELAVLISYTKSSLKQAFIDEKLASHPFARKSAFSAFPLELARLYPEDILDHPLLSEIVATQVANEMVNRLGISFVWQLQQQRQMSAANIALIWLGLKELFSLDVLWCEAERAGNSLTWAEQSDIYGLLMRFVSHAARRISLNMADPEQFLLRLPQLKRDLVSYEALLPQLSLQLKSETKPDAGREGVHPQLLKIIDCYDLYLSFLDIANTASTSQKPVTQVAPLYIFMQKRLKLDQLATAVENYNPQNEWQSLARETWLYDLTLCQRNISRSIIEQGDDADYSGEQLVNRWLEKYKKSLQKWDEMTGEAPGIRADELSAFAMMLRELEGFIYN
ncbi:NAD-glutamate dehydrogenase [Pantoea sp. A4]|uniref:NAD-glutamate dehydrogenase n=1 Tax=Pantoea sp. A4 TaxID=1225184 RepID=UPI0003793002|nr:NAD-glutamate dehydrogenase domain-containing protein [Pantoea sp. A4]